MTDFILLIFIIYFLFAVSNIVDKVMRRNFVKNSYSLAVLAGFVNFAIGLLMILYKPSVLTIPNQWIIIVSGIVSLLGGLLYYIALSKGEISRIVPIFNFVPIFSLILAFVLLEEGLSTTQIFAFVFIVAGGFTISIQKIKGIFKVDKALWLIIASSFLYALSAVLIKYGLASADFFSVQAFVQIGVFIGTLLVLPYLLKTKKITFKDFRYKLKGILVISFGECVYVLGRLIMNIVLVSTPVALVLAFAGLQGFFVFIIALVLSVYFSHILDEKVTRKIILTKVFALILIFIGSAILAYA